MPPTVTPTSADFAATDHLDTCPLPVPHLNGTGRQTLLTEYENARAALDQFALALHKVTCHGRDYYPAGADALTEAQHTRRQVFDLLDEIDSFLVDHIRHLSA